MDKSDTLDYGNELRSEGVTPNGALLGMREVVQHVGGIERCEESVGIALSFSDRAPVAVL